MHKIVFILLLIFPSLSFAVWPSEFIYDENFPFASRLQLLTKQKISKVIYPEWSFIPIYDESGRLVKWGDYYLEYAKKMTKYHPDTLAEIYTKPDENGTWTRETFSYDALKLKESSSKTFAKGKNPYIRTCLYDFATNSRLVSLKIFEADKVLGKVEIKYAVINGRDLPVQIVQSAGLAPITSDLSYTKDGLLAQEILVDSDTKRKWLRYYDRSVKNQIRIHDSTIFGSEHFLKMLVIFELQEQ